MMHRSSMAHLNITQKLCQELVNMVEHNYARLVNPNSFVSISYIVVEFTHTCFIPSS